MKNTKITLLFVPFAASIMLQAQVPGYQGKRLSIGYSNDISMANQHPNARGGIALNGMFTNYEETTDAYSVQYAFPNGTNPTGLAFNFTHKLSISYVTKRTSALEFDIKYFKSGIIFPYFNYTEYDPFFFFISYNINPQFTTLSGFGMDLQYRIFKDGLAPFGKYAGFMFGVAVIKAQTPDSVYMTYNPMTAAWTSGKVTWKDVNFPNVGLGYVYGKQNIIKDRFLVDRGFSLDVLGLCVAWLKSNDLYATNFTGKAAMDEFYLKNLKARVQWRNSINMYFSVKYLLK